MSEYYVIELRADVKRLAAQLAASQAEARRLRGALAEIGARFCLGEGHCWPHSRCSSCIAYAALAAKPETARPEEQR